MTNLEWETPPNDGRSSSVDYDAFFAALAERPGEWAVVKRDTFAATVRTVREAALRRGFTVQAIHRVAPGASAGQANAKGTVYARVLSPNGSVAS